MLPEMFILFLLYSPSITELSKRVFSNASPGTQWSCYARTNNVALGLVILRLWTLLNINFIPRVSKTAAGWAGLFDSFRTDTCCEELGSPGESACSSFCQLFTTMVSRGLVGGLIGRVHWLKKWFPWWKKWNTGFCQKLSLELSLY